MPLNCTSLGSRTRSQLSLRSVLLPSAEVSTGHPHPCVGRVTERDTVWRVPIPRHTGQRGRGHRLCAALCALFFTFVLLVDDAENLVLFLASDTDAFKRLTRSAVWADRAVIHTGKCWSGSVHLPAFRAGAWLVVAVFHRCTSFALIS